jgi:signal transduction histidine kinase/ligand-binding sensor domain-containing protein/DNA-binding response OmpR family regulator
MKIIIRLSLIIFTLFCYQPNFAHNAELNFQHLTMEDGLSSNLVYTVKTDSLGFLWFFTKNGIDRYDGKTIENIIFFRRDSQNSREAQFVFRDNFGQFWMGGMDYGLLRFNPYEFKIRNYNADSERPFSLSDNSTTSIFEDREKNLWVGTYLGGINCYNPETDSFISYPYLKNDQGNISSNQVNNFFEDEENNLWVATNSRLYKLEEGNKSFDKIVEFPYEGKEYINSEFRIICEDPKNVLWLQAQNGIIQFNNKLRKTRVFTYNTEIFNQAEARIYKKFYLDKENNFWLVHQNRLIKFDRQIETFSYYKCKDLSLEDPSSGLYSEIFEDAFGKIWIASHAGLRIFNKNTQQFSNGSEEIGNSFSLPKGLIYNIYPDQAGNIWISSDEGVFKYNLKRKLINYFQVFTNTETNINVNKINSIKEDSQGNLWCGTNNGLFEIERNFSKIKRIWCDPVHSRINTFLIDNNDDIFASTSHSLIRFNSKLKSIANLTNKFSRFFDTNRPIVFNLLNDRSGNIWFLIKHGLILYQQSSQTFEEYLFNYNDKTINNFNQIVQDSINIYWIATYKYIIKFNFETKNYEIFNFEKDGNPTITKALLLDQKKTLWIGKKKGLFKFDTQNESFIPAVMSFPDSINLETEYTYSFYEDDSGTIWIASKGFLVRYQYPHNNFTKFAEPGKDPYNDPIIHIIGDKKDGLWILRKSGVSRFNKLKNHFSGFLGSLNYGDYKDFLIRDDGFLVVATEKGLFYFQPDSFINYNIPKVVLTKFELFGKPFPLDSNITIKKKIILDYDQNYFGFRFAALDFFAPEKNQYAYKLEGLDHNWINNQNLQYARYARVPPGKYTFRVKGSNSDGYWNEEGTAIQIEVLPPWWQTTWTKIGYVLITTIILLSIWKTQTNRIRMKHQLEIEKLQSEKLQEIDRVKSHFFANISHEFRTPLTLIMSPLENLLKKTAEGEEKYELNLIHRSARRLYALIGQLLDLSKLESGEMKLQAELTDVTDFLKPMVISFAGWAEKKKITLKFQHPEYPVNAYLDTEIMEKIITNLLSNALKFTPEGGKVEIHLYTKGEIPHETDSFSGEISRRPEANHLVISIADSGPGIPGDKINSIFDRFYRLETNMARDTEGTGIGLALTRELVERHYGKISVQSKPGEGSTFSIMLPLGKNHLKSLEIIEKQTRSVEFFNIPDAYSVTSFSAPEPFPELAGKKSTSADRTNKMHKKSSPSILIVEDNPDLQSYMTNYLGEGYAILAASDGKEGLGMAMDFLPDLIISDIMMPEMNGFELCKRIKTEERTSHIPVILLTARADAESKLHGLETGADDYVTKPFDVKELQVRARNLIDQRRKLRERFRKELTIQPSEITVNSMDEQFLKHALEVAEGHLSDPEFTTSAFSREIGVSRQHLNDKLKALTDQSTREFLRTLRLKRAAQLLSQQAGNITEIAYEVGFNNLSHFAKIFKEQFGISPSEFANNCKNGKPH